MSDTPQQVQPTAPAAPTASAEGSHDFAPDDCAACATHPTVDGEPKGDSYPHAVAGDPVRYRASLGEFHAILTSSPSGDRGFVGLMIDVPCGPGSTDTRPIHGSADYDETGTRAGSWRVPGPAELPAYYVDEHSPPDGQHSSEARGHLYPAAVAGDFVVYRTSSQELPAVLTSTPRGDRGYVELVMTLGGGTYIDGTAHYDAGGTVPGSWRHDPPTRKGQAMANAEEQQTRSDRPETEEPGGFPDGVLFKPAEGQQAAYLASTELVAVLQNRASELRRRADALDGIRSRLPLLQLQDNQDVAASLLDLIYSGLYPRR